MDTRKIIAISGVIADFECESESNVTPGTLRQSLKDANGEDVLVTINSPGGYVHSGLEMFSILKAYSGNVETRIVSLAASMGSILALAGDKKTAESTAMYMVHNPIGYAYGDYQKLEKYAKEMRQMAEMFYHLYEKHTELSKDEAKALMDDETYFFGQEVETLGFESVEVDGDSDKPTASIMAKTRIREVEAKMTQEEMADDLEKAVASLSTLKLNKPKASVNIDDDTIKPETRSKRVVAMEVNMDLNELKSQHPEAYAQAVAVGAVAERDRVNAHLIMGEQSGDMKTALAACEDGSEMTATLQAKYMAAGMNKNALEARAGDEQGAGAADGADNSDDNKVNVASQTEELLAKRHGVKLEGK